MLAWNKIDRAEAEPPRIVTAERAHLVGTYSIAAATGRGLPELLDGIEQLARARARAPRAHGAELRAATSSPGCIEAREVVEEHYEDGMAHDHGARDAEDGGADSQAAAGARLLNLPNFLTIVRILTIPVFLILL